MSTSTELTQVAISSTSWSDNVNVLLAVLLNGTPEGKALCKREILRMAQIADLGVTALNTLVAINDRQPDRLESLAPESRSEISSLIAQGVALSNAPQAPQSFADAEDTAAAPDAAAAPVAIGYLAKKFCKQELPISVCYSAAGFYIGTYSEDGPCSRESVQYWPKREAAEKALATGSWTQRMEP